MWQTIIRGFGFLLAALSVGAGLAVFFTLLPLSEAGAAQSVPAPAPVAAVLAGASAGPA